MDMAVKKKFPYKAALVACNGGCRAAKGEVGCADGCIGCGECISACKFDAISLNEYGVAEVNEDKCIACGKCAKVCPQGIIHIHECANHIVVKCSNKSKGAESKKQCEVSCIGCGICEKTCTAGAVRIIDNHAVINEELCLSCGMCAVKCPRHAIYDLRGVFTVIR